MSGVLKNRGLRRVFTDFRRHPWLHVISISTITVALSILGGFFLCSRNFDNLAEKTSPQVTGTIYLREGLSEAQVDVLRARLMTLEGIQAATYKTRGSVVADLQAFLGSTGVDALPGSELFPDVIELQLRSTAGPMQIQGMKETIRQQPEVAEVDFSEDWLVQYKKARQMFEILGFVLLAAVLIGCSFIIANFMGMRHQSRKREIEIVRLIGGHRNFILTPFLYEGLIEGLTGASLALVILYLVKSVFSALLSVHWTTLLGIKEWAYLSPGQFAGILLMGVLIALCGSITVFLRFQETEA